MKKLKRKELAQLLARESKRAEDLEKELNSLKEQLGNRQIDAEETGTLAEAAMKINHVFENADAAGEQYLDNIRRICAEREEQSKAMLEDAERECREMKEKAEAEAQEYWDAVFEKMEDYCRSKEDLSGFLSMIPKKGGRP